MPQLRIALAQVNATVGDLAGNADLALAWTRRAAGQGARIVVFPEMMLTGYPVEDLALRSSFVGASVSALTELAARLAAEGLGGMAVVVGYLDRRAGLQPRVGLPSGAPQDAAALLYGGAVAVTSAKHHLPNYGVFDEYRYFVPGDTLPVFRLPVSDGQAVDVAIAICEDLWQDGGPVAVCHQAGAGLLVVPNASPYEQFKDEDRLALCQRRAREAGAPLAYANLVGGQDELVFDGDSIIVDAAGRLLARGPQFEEALIVADLDVPAADLSRAPGREPADVADGSAMTIHRIELGPQAAPPPDPAAAPQALWPRLTDLAEVYAALVTGVRDYIMKNGFVSVLIALSGGIDSALTTTIAVDAIGAEHVHVVLMPSRYSSAHSVGDAEELVKRQGVHARTISIAPMVDAFEAELDLHGLAAENLQARVRGMVLMSLSNEQGHLVLTTGNKSEVATGYSTLYGDSAGGYGPIKDVLKSLVWELSRWRNQRASERGETPPIPENSITKPPSAELAPGQLDSDSLPDYAVLDKLLDDYVEKDLGAAALMAAGHDPALVERVIRLVDRAEYKRRQYPPGPKISPKNFGRDRRLPITSRWRESLPAGTPTPPAVRYAVKSDVGRAREENEDAAYAGPRLLAVADGMGGHAAGEVASATAIEALRSLDTDVPAGELLPALERAVQQAGAKLRDLVEADPSLRGMGTTLTGIMWSGSQLGLVHIGDSRAYLLHDGELSQITHDHTVVQSLVDDGRITAAEAASHPQRSLLLRALGGPSSEPDLQLRDARPGDRYLLCSDGLHEVVPADEIARVLREAAEPDEGVATLVELANQAGGPDNITCIIADVLPLQDATAASSDTEVAR